MLKLRSSATVVPSGRRSNISAGAPLRPNGGLQLRVMRKTADPVPAVSATCSLSVRAASMWYSCVRDVAANRRRRSDRQLARHVDVLVLVGNDEPLGHHVP